MVESLCIEAETKKTERLNTMTYDEAIHKAAKLLRLATSSNANEAALAASKAQDIIDRFQIEKAAIDIAANGNVEPDEPIKDFGDDPIDAGKNTSTWKLRLICSIARANACRGYSSWRGMCLIGRPSDVATVRYIYGWMAREVEFLSLRNCKGYGRTYANNFKIGVVDTIKQKLAEQKEATKQAMRNEAVESNNQFALVCVNNAIARVEQKAQSVNKWVESNMKLRSVSATFRPHDTARKAGQIAGRQINIGRAKASVGRVVAGHIS